MPEGVARAVVFTLRLSEDEKTMIDGAAKRESKAVTQWAREALLVAAKGAGTL